MYLWLFSSIVLVLYILFRFKRRHMYTMAAKVPLPEDSLIFFGISLNFFGNTEDIMNKMVEYSNYTNRVGGIAKAWLGPFLYFMLTDSPKIEKALRNNLEKDDLHQFIRTFMGNASIFAPVSIWKPRRKVLASTFTSKIMSNFSKGFPKQAHRLVEELKPKVGAGNFKIWPFLNAYSMDAVLETGFGIKVNTQEDHHNIFLKAVNESFRLSCERIFQLWLQPDWLYRVLPQYPRFKYYTNIVHEFANQMIRKKKLERSKNYREQNRKGDEPDLLQSERNLTFLDLLITHSGGDNGFSDLELREEVLTLIVAAMDTTAVTMALTLKCLGKYPDIQEKVFDELDAVFEGSDRFLEREDLTKLKYLERVIKETLRLFPVVPFIIRKAVEDTPLDSEITIPKGAGIILSIWGVHRNPKYWGHDAHCFDPDRFLPERYKDVPPCAFIPFSFGPRNCLGLQYAMISIKTALSTLLRQFRVVGVPETRPDPHIRVKLEVLLKIVDGCEIALEKR